MGSSGVSVWFACKFCKSFFLNADDFAYHKKKSHVQEFRNTKFIVFEEQDTPTASPPENWVSFLSPKEETRIHKIISFPLSSPSTTTSVDCNPNNENIQSNRNEESIEIDPEKNKDLNDSHNESDDAGEETNNCIESSFIFNSNDDADQENCKNQSNVASTTTDSSLTDEKQDKLCSSRIKATLKRKTNSLRRSTRRIQNVSSKTSLLRSEIQSSNNPYVYLERLNLITIQNTPAPSNSTIHSQENDRSDTNHINSDAKSAESPKVKHENHENVIQRSSTLTLPPMAAVGNCKFCYDHFNSAAELDAHEDICPSQSQFKNIICVPSVLTVDSSDKLNAHNQAFDSTSISTQSKAETTKYHQPSLGDEHKVAVASRNEFQSDFLPAICNKSSVNQVQLSLNHGHGEHVYNTDFNHDFELAAVSNTDNNDNLVPDPTTEVVDIHFGPVFELVKAEYAAHGNEDSEFSDKDRDPFESVSPTESSAELTPNAAASFSSNSEMNYEKLLPQTDTSRYCISCQKEFISYGELKAHNKSYHEAQYGNKKFKCPHPNCGATTRDQYLLKMHVIQVHSNVRPYNCHHTNCTMSFKTNHSRNRHLGRAHLNTSSCQGSTRFETTNEGVSPSNHFDTELAPQTDFFRYCILCKKSFSSIQEIRNHNKTYHTTQEGMLRFRCPYLNCRITTTDQCNLKKHLIQVHCNLRPLKCPHPTCKMSFKTTKARNRHVKRHTNSKSAYLN